MKVEQIQVCSCFMDPVCLKLLIVRLYSFFKIMSFFLFSHPALWSATLMHYLSVAKHKVRIGQQSLKSGPL